MKLAAAVAALSVLAIPATASAQDELPVCPEGYVAYMSAGGPRCGNPIYLDGTWNDDPRDCVYGYYQGSCAPEPPRPIVGTVAMYTFQMTDPSPEYIAEVEAKIAVQREQQIAWDLAHGLVATEPGPAMAEIATPRAVSVGKIARFRAALDQLI